MANKEIQYCGISGRTVANLPFGADEENLDCKALKLKLSEQITEISSKGLTEFLCNCEFGVPMWAAEAVAGMKKFNGNLRLHLVIPHEEQAAKWHSDVRERYYSMHEKADEITFVSKFYYEHCYLVGDKHIINNSQMLITDDGNSFISRYAIECGKSVIFLNKIEFDSFDFIV